MVIETAFVAPILVVLALGGFDASQMVSRHTELQSAVAEAAAITLSSEPDTQAEFDTIEDIVEASSGLADNKVVFVRKYRCDNETALSNTDTCSSGAVVASYIEITLTETYTPVWTDFGIGSPVNLEVSKLAQIS